MAIRSQMAASTRFRGFAPAVVASTGLLALAAAAAQGAWPEQLSAGPVGYALFWTAIAVIATIAIAVEALGRSRRLHGGMADAMIGGTLRLFLPFGVVGALVTLVLVRVDPEACRLLPGLWQMLVALLGFSAAAATLPRSLAWGASWYLACAAIVLTLAAQTGDATPWMMGLPFGGGQMLVAALLHRAAAEQ
jgi:hypothetical protein